MDYQTLADVNTLVNSNSQYKTDLENYKSKHITEFFPITQFIGFT